MSKKEKQSRYCPSCHNLAFPFEYWLTSRPVFHKSRDKKGQIKKMGLGWPQWNGRWCTGFKVNCLSSFAKPILNGVHCIGYAKDEEKRSFLNRTSAMRFPLIEWGVTEKEALEYCYSKGYDWGGLYNIFPRVSCYCCPLQGDKELSNLRTHFPELWQKMREWDALIQENSRKYGFPYFGFKNKLSLKDLESKM